MLLQQRIELHLPLPPLDLQLRVLSRNCNYLSDYVPDVILVVRFLIALSQSLLQSIDLRVSSAQQPLVRGL